MTQHEIDKFELVSYFVGDCDSETRARVAKHLTTCLECNRKLEQLKRERTEFLQAHPFESFASRAQARRRSSALQVGPVYALAATLVLVVGLSIVLRPRQKAEAFRVKGASGIALFVKSGEESVEKRADNVYHPGEYVQITCSCAEADKLILLSIDEAGGISTYFPAQGDTSVAVAKGQNVPLPNSILLDDYLGKELFVAVFSRQPLYVPAVLETIRGAYKEKPDLEALSIAVPNGEVRTILITKAGPEK